MSRASRRGLDPEAVLADTVRPRPSAEQLAELIRRINPTGRALAPAEERRLYALKSALQSLLVRRHGDVVLATMDESDVVELTLEGTGAHAAHVPIDELDEDARAWVRRRLDAGDERRRASETIADPRDAGPLARARRLRSTRAYDDARALLEQALPTTTGLTSRVAVPELTNRIFSMY